VVALLKPAVLLEGIHSTEPVAGLTHNFYRYPARFSPQFARVIISEFTRPGDWVLDPFMGGGTSLVEACALGRNVVGCDVNSLAVFVTKAKTSILSESDLSVVARWFHAFLEESNLRKRLEESTPLAESQKNLRTRRTWHMRKLLAIALQHVQSLGLARQRRFARCVLLRTAQWALDCRSEIPSAADFRCQLVEHLQEMSQGARQFAYAVAHVSCVHGLKDVSKPICIRRSAIGIESDRRICALPRPKLILTSPPYPGVHVLYHRWQVLGRRETPAPFWIINSKDGLGASFYTFGDRKQSSLASYYSTAAEAFKSLAKIAGRDTVIVQLIAFSDPSWQLPAFLGVMQDSGFSELRLPTLANAEDGRVWRLVPNRKWYADQRGVLSSSKEVVLFHRLQ